MLVANNKTIADENVNIGDDNEVKSVKNADIVEDNSNKDKDSNKEEGTNIGKDNDNKDYKYEDSDIDKDKGEEFNDEGQTNKDKGNKDEVSVFGDFFLLYFSPLFIHPLISGNLNHHILLWTSSFWLLQFSFTNTVQSLHFKLIVVFECPVMH